MKIGLLTYHYSESYGATLQTYATCRTLQEMGHEVELINLPLHLKSSWIRNIAFLPRIIATKRFWKRIYPSLTKCYSSVEELRTDELDYDCLIVGSDQTWNPDISKDLCMGFFLDFGKHNVRRISYASSFGVEKWPDKHRNLLLQVKNAINRFSAISVREQTGKIILKEQFNVDATIVVDPTLLLTDYSELTGDIKDNGKLICFTMYRQTEQLCRVQELAKYMNMTPYQMATIHPLKGFSYIYPPTIVKWLKYIAGARFVVTDSFHGLVFSLIYRKPFVVITPENGLNSRLKDLLKLVGLENRYYSENSVIPYGDLVNEKIDYEKVHSKLNIAREKSISFLKDALMLD